MTFGLPLRTDPPPAVSAEPTLTYRTTSGTDMRLDERAPGDRRERALARGLVLHALHLLDTADQR